jgi:hypothetical protein
VQVVQPVHRRRHDLAARVIEFLDDHAIGVAIGTVTIIIAFLTLGSSLVVDGTRYFWLDDDQMVSMRYARNLASGNGFVWNPGERVEGYTSFGWALVMAGVHLLPLSDATTSLAVKIVSWLLACATIVLSDRLLRRFVPRPGLTRLAVLVTLALCVDLLFWAANAFETTLLTAIFLVGMLRVLDDAERESPRIATFLIIGLVPLARSDAFHLWGALIVVALAIHRDRLRVARLLPTAVVLPILHLVFRRWYYGAWLPNTYYLKVAGIHGLFWGGAGYLKSFVEAYSVPVLLTAGGALWAGDRRLRYVPAGALVTGAYVLTVGADNFPYSRFLAPWVPVLLVLGAAAAWQLSGGAVRARGLLVAALAIVTTIQSGVHGRTTLQLRSGNGTPEHGLVVGLMIRDNTRPDARVAVTAAGNVPYFSRRPAVDLLGKADAHVARLPPHAMGPIGHKKFDMDYSLSLHPDLVVTFLTSSFGASPESAAYVRSAAGQHDYRVALFTSRVFTDEYRAQPIPLPYLLERGAVYVRRSSPEAQSLDRWRMPAIGR